MGRRMAADNQPHNKVASSTVVKAMSVLQSLAALHAKHPEGASVTEISRSSGESPSSVCKHLAAFQLSGLVEQDSSTERYRIGLYALQLAAIALKNVDVRAVAAPLLSELAERSGETVHLVILDGLRVVYIDKVESSKAIRMHSQIGGRNPLYCTGVGKAILAHAPKAIVEAVISEGFHRFTDTTLVSREALLTDLHLTAARGYAIDNEEHQPDVRCAAAAIFNHLGEPVASVSAAGPKWRLTDERLAEIGEAVRATANEISRKLGMTS